MQTQSFKFEAILSTTILPSDGIYRREEILFTDDVLKAIKGTPHYVGHPATKAILEDLGATPVEGKFLELKPGESFLAVPLANNPRGGDGAREGTPYNVTVDSLSGLKAVVITRIPEQTEMVSVHRDYLVRAAGKQTEAAAMCGMDIGDYILDAYVKAALEGAPVVLQTLAQIMSSKGDQFSLKGTDIYKEKAFYWFRDVRNQGARSLDEVLAIINNK